MAIDSLTDGASAFNRSSNSESPSFQRPSHREYLNSLDKELSDYLGRVAVLVSLGNQSAFAECSKADLHHYFSLLDEQVFGAVQTFNEILEEKNKNENKG